MTSHEQPPWEGLSEGLDAALRLVTQARYKELRDHAAALERQAADLAQLKGALEAGQEAPEGTRAGCEQLQQKILMLSEVLRHATAVEAALREIEAAAAGGYSRQGQTRSADGPRWKAEG